MMKKVCILMLSLLLLLGVAGCGLLPQPAAQPATDEEEQDVEIIPPTETVEDRAIYEEDDITSDASTVAEQYTGDDAFEYTVTAEDKQYFFDNYFVLLPNWMLLRTWDMESMIHQLPTPNGPYADQPIFPAIMLMIAFETIVGWDERNAIVEQYGFSNVPANIVESVLLRYFPFTTNQLRDIMAREGRFDESTNTYTLVDEIRYSTMEDLGIITDIERSAGYVRLFYDVYYFDVGLGQITSDIAYSGILTLHQSEAGYVFVAVTLTYGFVNWGA